MAPSPDCGILVGVPQVFVRVPSQNIGNDLAMIDYLETMIRSPMILLLLMNLFGSVGQVGWLDQ